MIIIARKIDELYYRMNILTTNDYEDCSASDLIYQYIAQTVSKPQAKLTESLDAGTLCSAVLR